MTAILTAIAAILIFTLMIFVHELGHFITAKLVGVRVLEFAIGMGPKLWSRQWGETVYSVRAIPIGGFCAMEGENGDSSDPRAFYKKAAWKRLIVLAAGAFMNILLGFLLLCAMPSPDGLIVTTEVKEVEPASAAERGGLMAGDTIVKVAGSRTHLAEEVHWAVQRRGAMQTEFVIRRGGEKKVLLMAPQEEDGRYLFGFTLDTVPKNALQTLKEAYYGTFFYSKLIIGSFFDLFRGEVKMTELSGPIGIVSEIGSAVQETARSGMIGLMGLFLLAILLTINLGIFNLLPIPALDGGRIFFVLIEMIRRKPIPLEKEGMVHAAGFALLILLSVVIAVMDIMKFWI